MKHCKPAFDIFISFIDNLFIKYFSIISMLFIYRVSQKHCILRFMSVGIARLSLVVHFMISKRDAFEYQKYAFYDDSHQNTKNRLFILFQPFMF